jgi:hypothetical protein
MASIGKTARFFLAAALLLAVWLSALGPLSARAMPAPGWGDDPYPLPPTPGQSPGQPAGSFKVYLPLIAASRPFEDFSYYMASGDYMYALGRRRAESYATVQYPTERLAILLFGAAWDDNQILSYELNDQLEKIKITISSVESRVKYYIQGFYYNIEARPVFLTVAVGINASRTLPVGNGTNWGYMINNLNDWVVANGYQDHIYVVGAIDIEPEWGLSPWEITPWIDAYDTVSNHRVYNFGNAIDCPRDIPPTEPEHQTPISQSCLYANWYQDDIANISRGIMRPLPQIYNYVGWNAERWYRIGLFRKFQNPSDPLVFHGSLTQYYACEQGREDYGGELPPDCIGANNSPNVGYNQLLNILISDPYDRVLHPMYYKTDILWYQGDYQCLYPDDPYPECSQ